MVSFRWFRFAVPGFSTCRYGEPNDSHKAIDGVELHKLFDHHGREERQKTWKRVTDGLNYKGDDISGYASSRLVATKRKNIDVYFKNAKIGNKDNSHQKQLVGQFALTTSSRFCSPWLSSSKTHKHRGSKSLGTLQRRLVVRNRVIRLTFLG